MVKKSADRLELAVGDVIRWGEESRVGVVQKIRVIGSGKFAETFSGNFEEVMLSVRDELGVTSVWAAKLEFQKANDHEAKEFKSKLKGSEDKKGSGG